MSVVTINEQILDDIASQTRAKNGESTLYKPNQIPSAIHRIETPKLEERFLVENGEYYPNEGRNGISKVTVSVSASFSEADEGKVVSNGSLVEQTGLSVSQNGSYDTTLNDSVVVDVLPNLESISISANGTYEPSNSDGYSQVVVDVPSAILESISISENGTYTPSQADGFSEVVVNVSGGGGNLCELIERTASSVTDFEASIIASYAFYSYSSLKSVNFPNAESIYDSAFYYCSRLSDISFPNVTLVSNYAFFRCSSLTNVNFPIVETIGWYAFASCSVLVSADFPEATLVHSSAFSGCSSLVTAHFPLLKIINSGVFYYCSRLSDISFPAAEEIRASAFFNCYSLTVADFPNVTSIAMSAFRGCSNLSKVILSQISRISQSAFYGCVRLISLYLYCSSIPSLTNAYVFSSTPIGGYSTSAGQYGSIYVPASLYNDYKLAGGWGDFYSRYAIIETPISVAFVKEGFSKTISAYEMSWRDWIETFSPFYEDFQIGYNNDELFAFVNESIDPGYCDIYDDSALTSICTANDTIEEKTYYLKKRD